MTTPISNARQVVNATAIGTTTFLSIPIGSNETKAAIAFAAATATFVTPQEQQPLLRGIASLTAACLATKLLPQGTELSTQAVVVAATFSAGYLGLNQLERAIAPPPEPPINSWNWTWWRQNPPPPRPPTVIETAANVVHNALHANANNNPAIAAVVQSVAQAAMNPRERVGTR